MNCSGQSARNTSPVLRPFNPASTSRTETLDMNVFLGHSERIKARFQIGQETDRAAQDKMTPVIRHQLT